MPPNHNHPIPVTPQRPKSFRTNPGRFIITWAITLTLLPFIFLLLGSLCIYRALIRLIAGRNKSLASQLTPYDSIFAVDSYETRPYASNLTVLEMKSRVDLGTLRNLFQSRILSDPKFSKLNYRPVEYLGYWFWQRLPENPDVNKTVYLHHDSELDLCNKTLDDCLREIVEMPFDYQLYNVALMHFGNKSILVFRIHHTVCDGYSFNKLIDKFVGLESKYLVRNVVKELSLIGKLKSLLQQIIQIGTLIFYLPLHVAQLYRESLTHTPNFFTLPKSSTTGSIRRTVFPLSQMKQIRQFSNSHFASTGMALMTGALQRFYDSECYPTNLRPDRLSIMHSLPRANHPMNSDNKAVGNNMCNWWGVGLFKIPFLRDSVSRLFGAEEDFDEYMTLQYHNYIHIHIPIISMIPCFVVKWFFSINFGTSCGFTSVPGLFDRIAYVSPSPQDRTDGGALDSVEVSHMWKVFGLQWRQSAVAVAMYTYRGEASLSVYANKGDIVRTEEQMDRLVGYFHEEFNELLHASEKQSKPDARKNA